LIKAVGGLLGAVWLGGITAQHTWQWPVNTLLIALSANAINLFDLRPGRAITISLVALPVCTILAVRAAQLDLVIGLILIWSMCFFWRKEDAQAKAMMGDSGSNLLGAVMGVSLAVCLPAWASASWLVVLILLHLAAERGSFSQVIERTPCLARIDRLTGLRKPSRKTTR
jgi:UDP-N-acetylmuramyl pentapeptide phosphotransferase/UDP-N-acetylglucosamine-1-phosphate transferase